MRPLDNCPWCDVQPKLLFNGYKCPVCKTHRVINLTPGMKASDIEIQARIAWNWTRRAAASRSDSAKIKRARYRDRFNTVVLA